MGGHGAKVKGKRIVATIQARMGSSRLPGKPLKPVVGKPVLQLIVERLEWATLLDDIVVATTVKPADDAIEELCNELGVNCFRGSEDDVLGRIVEASRSAEADIGVEMMADSPFPDPAIVDQVIQIYLDHNYDYVSNCLKTTYPPGLEVRVYTCRILEDVLEHVCDPADREHVSFNIYKRPDRYRLLNIEAPDHLKFPDIYLELDSPEDLEVVRIIYEALYSQNPAFTTEDILEFLKANLEVAEKNRRVERRWKKLMGGPLPPGVDSLKIQSLP